MRHIMLACSTFLLIFPLLASRLPQTYIIAYIGAASVLAAYTLYKGIFNATN